MAVVLICLGLHICFDEYNYNESLQVNLIEQGNMSIASGQIMYIAHACLLDENRSF